ncbi:unnamed protein product [Caenorhabditis auriculariae]|uniref:C2H2-type domain-containing protein n=1 Tax=Caenorhabditis auriculariae TaxID=2777116 RepID=A0A8S1GPW8_9PELO|nr:unnamed protein product [Caenorhabditis auriculariae]
MKDIAANHIREGHAGNSALYRLANTKAAFQVLCKPCQEVLSSTQALREHCDSVAHRTQLRQPIVVFSCKLCPFETNTTSEATAHMTCHEPSTWPREQIGESSIQFPEKIAI